VQSYDDIKQCPAPKTRAVEAKFAKLLQDIYSRHAPVLLTMARGVWELRESFKGTKDNINEVSLRVLILSGMCVRVCVRLFVHSVVVATRDEE
jgi:Mitochondrial branched-chain alpha-ketoacid dehydrogenase kinase